MKIEKRETWKSSVSLQTRTLKRKKKENKSWRAASLGRVARGGVKNTSDVPV